MNAPASTLYTRNILRLAMALPHDERLTDPDGTASCRAPLCGSAMTADVMLDDDRRISAVAFRAHSCALGQASAAALRDHALGLDHSAIIAARDTLSRYLCGEDADLPWEELYHFAAARSLSARHGAILLAYDAVLAAMENAT
jgi:NifU-like protein involved in Fe-S cluster formation